MPEKLSIYLSGASASAAPAASSQPLELGTLFPWVAGRQAEAPGISEKLAAEIREALAAVERGDVEDLGDFSQYLDNEN